MRHHETSIGGREDPLHEMCDWTLLQKFQRLDLAVESLFVGLFTRNLEDPSVAVPGEEEKVAVHLAGKRSGEIAGILGYRGRNEMIHRDDLVLTSQDSTS